MAKKVQQVLKLNLQGGSATPAPPVGPALGQTGINMMDFLKQYNDATKDKRGQVIPAEITVYQDKSFTFVLKLPPISDLIKNVLKIKKGSSNPSRESAGTLTMDQAKEIAQEKLPDLNTNDLDSAVNSVIGAARSMGIQIKE